MLKKCFLFVISAGTTYFLKNVFKTNYTNIVIINHEKLKLVHCKFVLKYCEWSKICFLLLEKKIY